MGVMMVWGQEVGTHTQVTGRGVCGGSFLLLKEMWFICCITDIDSECTAGELCVVNKSLNCFNPYLI